MLAKLILGFLFLIYIYGRKLYDKVMHNDADKVEHNDRYRSREYMDDEDTDEEEENTDEENTINNDSIDIDRDSVRVGDIWR